jgi:hypothetical protein
MDFIIKFLVKNQSAYKLQSPYIFIVIIVSIIIKKLKYLVLELLNEQQKVISYL